MNESIEDEEIMNADNINEIEKPIQIEPENNSFLNDIDNFFQNYLIDTPDGFLQVFQSFTYGEMVISFLLLLLVMLYAFKWIWEVLR